MRDQQLVRVCSIYPHSCTPVTIVIIIQLCKDAVTVVGLLPICVVYQIFHERKTFQSGAHDIFSDNRHLNSLFERKNNCKLLHVPIVTCLSVCLSHNENMSIGSKALHNCGKLDCKPVLRIKIFIGIQVPG